MSPQETLRNIESNPDFTPKERAKGIGICLFQMCKTDLEIVVCWDFCDSILLSSGYESIGACDLDFIRDLNAHPKKYANYK